MGGPRSNAGPIPIDMVAGAVSSDGKLVGEWIRLLPAFLMSHFWPNCECVDSGPVLAGNNETAELYHYRARMYDPPSGRFCSRDPIGYAAD